MSQVFVKLCGKIFLLVFLSLCISHPRSATCQSGAPGASAGRAEQLTAISDVGRPSTDRDTANSANNKSKKGSFILTEVEPLLLLLFGLLLFSVATGVKLKLARANRASSQYFEPLVSRSAGRSGTRS